MEVIIIALRILLPVFVLRFPISTIVAVTWLDFIDHNYLGQYEDYQVIDKFLDLYYLAFCFYASQMWKDIRARKLALGLFVYRAVGSIVLALTNQEWVLLFFPNMFEIFFVFYILYQRLSGSDQLLASWRSSVPILIALSLPKLIQEYALHVDLPYPQLTPAWLDNILGLPFYIGAVLWLALPVGMLWLKVLKTRQEKSLNVRPDIS